MNLEEYYDVIVVGAGPSGSTAAKFAALSGASVLLLEKDREAGVPVRCGEAVSRKGIEEFLPSDEKWISSRINKFTFVAPDDNFVEVEYKDDDVYILDRKIFDSELASAAVKEGANLFVKSYVCGLMIKDGKVCGVKAKIFGEDINIQSKIVIAADGVESRAARWAGLAAHIDFREMESCAQYVLTNLKNFDNKALSFYFGKEVAPEGYLWIFPKGGTKANVGLGISGGQNKKKSALKYLNEFIERKFPGSSHLSFVSGGVPCVPTLKKISAPGIMIAGDAARQVNPLSGGGITSGMIGGALAGKIAGEAVKRNSLDYISVYDKEWNKRLGGRHEIYNKIKNGIYNFSDEKFNNLAKSVQRINQNERTIGKIFKTALIDNPSLLIDAAKVFL